MDFLRSALFMVFLAGAFSQQIKDASDSSSSEEAPKTKAPTPIPPRTTRHTTVTTTAAARTTPSIVVTRTALPPTAPIPTEIRGDNAMIFCKSGKCQKMS